MPTSIVVTLMKEVATLRTDMEWVKKGIYLCVGSSVAATLAVMGEIVLKFVVR